MKRKKQKKDVERYASSTLPSKKKKKSELNEKNMAGNTETFQLWRSLISSLLSCETKKLRRRKKRNEWNLTAMMTCCCVYQNGDDKSTHLETMKDDAVIQ